MSMPVIAFVCSGCDFSQTSDIAWGSRVYVLPSGAQVRAASQLGWCHDCEGLAAVEVIQTVDEWLARVREADNAVASLGAKPIRHWWQFWGREVGEWQERYEAAVKLVEASREAMEITGRRESGPRCMTCSGVRVEFPFDEIAQPHGPPAPVPTGFSHPGCGGELMAKVRSGMMVSIRPLVHRYTPEGEFIETFFP